MHCKLGKCVKFLIFGIEKIKINVVDSFPTGHFTYYMYMPKELALLTIPPPPSPMIIDWVKILIDFYKRKTQ